MKIPYVCLSAASCTVLPVDTDLLGSEIPLINQVFKLPCELGDPPTGGAAAGPDLHRASLSGYPDAKCNDGTEAVMFIREAETEENANRWVLWTQGSSRCTSYEECQARWCGANSYDLLDSKVVDFHAGVYEALEIEVTEGELAERLATWNRDQMLSLGDLPATAEEGSAIHTAPGAFAQVCGKHTVLESSTWFFNATLEDETGQALSVHDALAAWLEGTEITLIDTAPPENSVCPE